MVNKKSKKGSTAATAKSNHQHPTSNIFKKFTLLKRSSYLFTLPSLFLIVLVLLKLVSCSLHEHQNSINTALPPLKRKTNVDMEKYLESGWGTTTQSTSQPQEAVPTPTDSLDSSDYAEKWSDMDDPNYERGLAKLLQTKRNASAGARTKSSTSSGRGSKTSKSNTANDKPAYLFSIKDMKELFQTEAQIYDAVEEYITLMESRIQRMKKWMEDYEESTVKGVSQVIHRLDLNKDKLSSDDSSEIILTQLVSNPIVTHRAIRRYSKDLMEILETFVADLDHRFIRDISDITSDTVFPTEVDDYKQSLISLLRIQIYNNYTALDLAKGKLSDLYTNISLNSQHAIDISRSAGENSQIALSIEWKEVALKLMDEEGFENLRLRKTVESELDNFVAFHDSEWKRYHKVSNMYYTEKIGSNYGSHVPHRPRYHNQMASIAKRKVEKYGIHTKNNFRTLCSGVNVQTEEEKRHLKCWLDTKKHPYWTINPLKVELLSSDPPLYQIYDILTPSSIQWMLKKATPFMRRSMVINVDDPNQNDESDVRTSAQTWLREGVWDPIMDKVFKEIEFASGLRVRKRGSSELLQIASYGTSHHYDEHIDALLDERRFRENGDRIATWMFYLTDVEVGGKTAFPVLGTAAVPVAGSAVFWYNLKKNGTPDRRTWHGGCPVVHGIKWVANKWILHYKNWDRRRCSLNPEE